MTNIYDKPTADAIKIFQKNIHYNQMAFSVQKQHLHYYIIILMMDGKILCNFLYQLLINIRFTLKCMQIEALKLMPLCSSQTARKHSNFACEPEDNRCRMVNSAINSIILAPHRPA